MATPHKLANSSLMQIFAVATFNIIVEAICVSPFLVYLNNIIIPTFAT